MPAMRISGEVTIGNCNFFGVGSIILQQIKIGNSIRLGAGSVLMRKPKDGCLYMGNPAKKTEL
jgi:acetyltransferase-like isoleucine patch superfamily enzyme